MKVIDYREAPSVTMDNDVAKGVTGRVTIGKADGAENFCMRVFELGSDGNTPKHNHQWEHEIFFHSGRGRIFIDDKWNTIEPGYVAFVPSGIEHQIKNTGEENLVFVCLIPQSAPEI